MSDPYPTLTEMGVLNPSQIQTFSVTRVSRSKDLLRIKYRRPSGSYLAASRSYEFDRTPKASQQANIPADELTSWDISPILDAAMLELETLVKRDRTRKELVEAALQQLDHIEADLSSLRALLGDLPTA